MAKIVVPTTNTVITSAWGKSIADELNTHFVQAGRISIATAVNGAIDIYYPVPFASTPTVTATVISATTAVPLTAVQDPDYTNASHVVLVIYNNTGRLVSTVVTLGWIAVGAR